MSTLAVFDFDGTLFRSPDAPPGAPEKFYMEQESLGPPCVPESPGPEWWVPKTVSAAKRAIADQDTWVMMMTGRADFRFRWRIPELLKQKGLNFDEVYLNPGMNTGEFKLARMWETLERYPFIDRVVLWDDKQDLLEKYDSALSKAGYDVTTHLVTEGSPEPLCSLWDLEKNTSAGPKDRVAKAYAQGRARKVLASYLEKKHVRSR